MRVERQDGHLPPAVVEDLLAEPRRRLLLALLYRRGDRVSLTELSTELADECGHGETPKERRNDVCQALRETDLPKLVATDVVRYHSTLDAVMLSSSAAELDDRLAAIAAEHE